MATTHYSVIRYVPDLAAGESINVGLMIFPTDGAPLVKSVRSWERVERFAGGDIGSVKEFVSSLEAGVGPVLSVSDARRLSDTWHYAVRVSQPQPSILTPEELIADLEPIFLRSFEAKPKSRAVAVRIPHRTHAGAVKEVYDTLRRTVEEFGVSKKVIRTKLPHSGKRGQHCFDVGGVNGQLYFVGQAISFDCPNEEKIGKEVDSAKWRFRDVRDADQNLTLAMFAFLPEGRGSSPLLDQTRKDMEEFNVDVVTEAKLPDWSSRVGERIASHRYDVFG